VAMLWAFDFYPDLLYNRFCGFATDRLATCSPTCSTTDHS